MSFKSTESRRPCLLSYKRLHIAYDIYRVFWIDRHHCKFVRTQVYFFIFIIFCIHFEKSKFPSFFDSTSMDIVEGWRWLNSMDSDLVLRMDLSSILIRLTSCVVQVKGGLLVHLDTILLTWHGRLISLAVSYAGVIKARWQLSASGHQDMPAAPRMFALYFDQTI